MKTSRVIIFLILINISMFAQPGIKAGLNVSALQSSSEDFKPFLGYEVDWIQDGTSNPAFGLQLGVFYTFSISDFFNFQPELFYSQKGYRFDQIPLYNTIYNLNIDYIELPLLIEYKLPFNWDFKPGLIAGTYAALNINSTNEIITASENIKGDVSSVNDVDYGLIFGFGGGIGAFDGEILIELRVTWGLSNIMIMPEQYISISNDPGTVKTRTITLMTGYRFNHIW